MHQSTTLTADLLYIISDDWIGHVSTSGYMDRYGQWKAMIFFTNYQTHTHAIHKHCTIMDTNLIGIPMHLAWRQTILSIVLFLKYGDSINNQPNDNVFDANAKSVYKDEKMAWDEVFMTIPFLPAHMNIVIVKIWARLLRKAGSLIKQSLKKFTLFLYVHHLPTKLPQMLISLLFKLWQAKINGASYYSWTHNCHTNPQQNHDI